MKPLLRFMGPRQHHLNMKSISVRVAFVFAALALATTLLADGVLKATEAGGASAGRVLTKSVSGRFAVVGPGTAVNHQYARWAEDTATRLERLLGVSFAFTGQEPVEIAVVADKTAGPAVTVTCERDGAFKRTLTVNESHQPEYESMQEGLCALLLDGYLDDRRHARGLALREPAVPQWFSMGVAQNLAPETRNRDRKIVCSWSPPPERPDVAAILRWRSLPEGWPRNRALCGMAVYWLGTMSEGSAVYARLLDGLAGDDSIGPEWVAERVANVGSVAALERAWREWLVRQGRTVQDLGALSSALLERLRSELDIELPVAGQPATGARRWRRLTPADVQAERRPSAFLRLAAGEKVQAIRVLTLGKASELVEVGEAYCRFYEGVARGSWRLVTKYRLAKAEAAFEQLAALTRGREAYLDEVEREMAGGDEQQVLPRQGLDEPVLEKDPIEAYLDDAENRFGKRETDKGAGRPPGP